MTFHGRFSKQAEFHTEEGIWQDGGWGMGGMAATAFPTYFYGGTHKLCPKDVGCLDFNARQL